MKESESPIPNKRPRHLGEDLFILISILSLWPVILNWHHPIYEVVMYLALAGLIWIFTRRIKRFRRTREGMVEEE